MWYALCCFALVAKGILDAIFLPEEEPEDKLKYTYNGYYEDNKSYDEEQSKSVHN